MHTEDNRLLYFNRNNPTPSLTMSRNKQSDVLIKILKWDSSNKEIMKWMVKSSSGSITTDYDISLLKADCTYCISKNGIKYSVEKSDSNGNLHFSCKSDSEKEDIFELKKAE